VVDKNGNGAIADEYWSGGATIATVQSGGASSKFGTFNFGLTIGINSTGFQLGTQSCGVLCGAGGDGFVQVIGSGDILGGRSLNPAEWTARSDTGVQFAPIAEPGSLALLGIAMTGLDLLGRRRAVRS
jgi:hypothetical protein